MVQRERCDTKRNGARTNREYEVKMWVRFEISEETTIISTLQIPTPCIKIRNIRH
jgi:hypothetical protein